jgi:elongation factor P
MDMETYDQLPVPSEIVGEAVKYLKESDEIIVASSGTDVYAVDPPMFVSLEVTDTEPGFKGDTASAGTKGATLETGLSVQVPLFIEKGDVVRIDTRDGRYVERVSRGG